MTNSGLGAVDFNSAFLMTIEPTEQDIDLLGHVNNTVYVKWAEQVAIKHWDVAAPGNLIVKYLFVLLRHEIDYREELLLSETAEVRTWLGRAKGPRFERFVDIRKPGSDRFCSFSRLDWCNVDLQTRKPKRVGQDLLDLFQLPG